eukprot:scaffold68193_cov33-Tisochrysis_lutea.AAC.1
MSSAITWQREKCVWRRKTSCRARGVHRSTCGSSALPREDVSTISTHESDLGSTLAEAVISLSAVKAEVTANSAANSAVG